MTTDNKQFDYVEDKMDSSRTSSTKNPASDQTSRSSPLPWNDPGYRTSGKRKRRDPDLEDCAGDLKGLIDSTLCRFPQIQEKQSFVETLLTYLRLVKENLEFRNNSTVGI